ncbi:hypothetical protein FACS1894218_5090 [Bacilli bacterium]|nr:hypothetical protein FACS1894218_5090 [Bacilli bacterium]
MDNATGDILDAPMPSINVTTGILNIQVFNGEYGTFDVVCTSTQFGFVVRQTIQVDTRHD